MVRYPARDLDLVLQGGYPPEYVRVTGGPNLVITTCPANVWRVITELGLSCEAAAAGNRMWLSVLRSGVYYLVGQPDVAAAAYRQVSPTCTTPIILKPGDSLVYQDTAAGSVNLVACAGFVDVPIPDTGEGDFRRVKRG